MKMLMFVSEGIVVERFIHEENLKLFRARLAEATDEKQRQTLRELIRQEEAKFRHQPSQNQRL
jgi:hypothetical protein